jgi:HlyD family secretion protein
MHTPLRTTVAIALAVLFVVVGLVVALRPRPVGVDVARLERGPMQVAIEEEGRTRVRNLFAVSAPVTGRMLRMAIEVGDPVIAGETTIALMQPAAPAFLDERSRLELQALLGAAEAAVALAEAERTQARSELAFAESELARAEQLVRSAATSERALEKARLDVATRQAALARAEAAVALRASERQSAEARLVGPQVAGAPHHPADEAACCIHVRAPVGGRVLTRISQSERTIAIGTVLAEIGDPGDLEVVVELLSTDAVKVAAGAGAEVVGWGRPRALPATVRRIEPAGFTKVSALGIEEQRVRVVLDLAAPSTSRPELGHDYRVTARILTWQSPATLTVPLAALFRRGGRWAVFELAGDRARTRLLEIGHRNSEVAEVTSGLEAGARVVLHPSDRVADGVRLTPRAAPP